MITNKTIKRRMKKGAMDRMYKIFFGSPQTQKTIAEQGLIQRFNGNQRAIRDFVYSQVKK